MKKIAISFIFFIMLGCSSVPLTGRRQLNLVSDQEVLALSNQSFSDYMKTAKVSTDYMKTLQVARVGQRIANAVMSFLRNNGMTADAASYNWQFVLVNDNTQQRTNQPANARSIWRSSVKHPDAKQVGCSASFGKSNIRRRDTSRCHAALLP